MVEGTKIKRSKKIILAHVLIAIFLIFIGLAIFGSLLQEHTDPTYVSYSRLNLSGTEGLIVKNT